MPKSLSQKKIDQIIKLHNQGKVSREIAKQVGVSKTAARKYINLHKAEIETYEQAEDACAEEVAKETPEPVNVTPPLPEPTPILTWIKDKALFIGGMILISLLAWFWK